MNYGGKMTLAHTKEIKVLTSFVPNKMWFSLKECCALKGINYKTICNHTELQPQCYSIVSGRKMFRRDIVLPWLITTDED